MRLEPPSGFLPTDASCCALLAQAAEGCARRFGLMAAEVLCRLEEGDRELHSQFRYELAKALSAYLADLGAVFREVYVYGSAIADGSNPSSDMDVIVVVNKRRDVTTAFLRRLDLDLTAHYRRLLGLKRDPRSLLDVRVVEAMEQAERSGYGAVTRGLFTCPICLWRSDPAITGAFRSEGPQRSPASASRR